MTDRIFSAVLTFLLLAGGTFAVGSELLGGTHTVPAKTLHATSVAARWPMTSTFGSVTVVACRVFAGTV